MLKFSLYSGLILLGMLVSTWIAVTADTATLRLYVLLATWFFATLALAETMGRLSTEIKVGLAMRRLNERAEREREEERR
jgi:hypothetical protein